ncbi:FtsX-like permease family protein [Erysipelothrix sp. HDW6C]|uniref:ABC transporter permease n=1 Tax=Erysipelothrix sp. HDW6C TaxID=2714930 RepID=UPI00140C0E9A|nr:ABC transporter permease [Erysipelothrix sp. HDW6C]QIK70463.1 FtsX-like permease family protein [Erysipelothrix sp. HDW6C]
MVKDILREIKAKWFQFVAIMIITALGVGFFVGIRVTGYDMRATADKYMETSDVLDLEFRHSLGIDKEMITQLSDIVDGEAVGVYDADAFIRVGSTDGVVRVIELNSQTELDITVLEGTMPKAKNEVVIDANLHDVRGLKIGDTVQLKPNDIFEGATLTIVGYANSSLYMNQERGSSSIGSGSVLGFMYGFDLDKKVDVFTSARFAIPDDVDIKTQQALLESNEAAISSARFDRITKPIIQELVDGQVELDANIVDANAVFEQAEQDLDRAKVQLDDAYNEINNGINEMAAGIDLQLTDTSLQGKLDALVNATNNLENNEQVTLVNGISDVDNAITTVEAGIAGVKQAISIEKDPAKLAALQVQLTTLEGQLAELKASQTQLKNQLQVLQTSIASLRTAQTTLQAGITTYNTSFEQYNEGVSTLAANRITAESEFASAQQKIDDGYQEIADADHGKQYILQREDVLIGYKEFYQDSDRIEAIGQVFPLIFFGVAILVTLSTISRMVDESRSQIGVYKALGYSWFYSSMKFVGFAFFSWIVGSIAGVIFGFYMIPTLIYNAYRIMYLTPPLEVGVIASYAWIPLIVSFISSVGVAMFKAVRVSREKTANLLRPPVPKGGQRIFLERIPFLWNRMSFLYKVSFRNLFRNKTRFLMTIIGIGGCAGLLITGFGLQHSIYTIVDKQFDDIIRYDGVITFDETVDTSTVVFENSIKIASEMVSVEGTDTQVYAIDDFLAFPEFTNLQDRRTHTPIELKNDTVVITEKLAILKGLKVGDTFSMKIGEREYPLTVGGITENYVLHYIYMSSEMYTTVTGKAPSYNMMMFKTEQDHTAVSTELLKQDSVYAVTFLSDMRIQYADMMGNFDIVIVVITGAAFALELIVLLNLITMNMSERNKELATLKVLGFYPKELATYIMRENIILTGVSLIFGAIFGYYLHQFVILQAELDAIMFNRELLWTSVAGALALTFAISVIINLVMSRKANNVNMSEALKTFDE